MQLTLALLPSRYRLLITNGTLILYMDCEKHDSLHFENPSDVNAVLLSENFVSRN